VHMRLERSVLACEEFYFQRLRRWRRYDISASVSGADFMIGSTYGRRRPRSAQRRRSLTNT